MWLEKRRALLAALDRRGHEVSIFNKMTKFSEPLVPATWEPKKCDLLMVEFGSSNTQFYGEHLSVTRSMVEQHKGPIIYLCDDPDLPYQWKTELGRLERWAVWMNATRGEAFGGQPSSIPILDAPFAAMLPKPTGAGIATEPAVYIGRPKGREKAFREVLEAGVELEVCGREKEWTGFNVKVLPAPEQGVRSEFYRRRLASVVMADKKHKRMGWRTGRAYHALYAGTPAIVEADHVEIAEQFASFRHAEDLKALLL